MKYTIKMSCGHEEEVTLFGKSAERDRKIQYFEKYGLCKECYKQQEQKKIESEPLSFNVSVLPYINENNGEILLFAYFGGNVKLLKDEIKKLGYKWQTKDTPDNMLGFDLHKSELCWGKIIDLCDFEDELLKAESLGAETFVTDKGLATMITQSIAISKQKEWKKKHEEIAALEKPETPEIIRGYRWNRKIYGKAGRYSIYLDGEKTEISDDEKKMLTDYLAELQKYNKKVEDIKNVK